MTTETEPASPNTAVTTIHSNGSKWLGQPPDPIEKLLTVLAAEPLSPRFENYGNFVLENEDGGTRFWGNFHGISHVFQIDTTDPKLVDQLTDAIRANQQTEAYKAARAQVLAKEAAYAAR